MAAFVKQRLSILKDPDGRKAGGMPGARRKVPGKESDDKTDRPCPRNCRRVFACLKMSGNVKSGKVQKRMYLYGRWISGLKFSKIQSVTLDLHKWRAFRAGKVA